MKKTKNNHYVPQLVLRNFTKDKVLSIYDVENKMLEANVSTERAFAILGLYTDKVEDGFNKKVEKQFANILKEVILPAKEKIIIERKTLRIIKKFLLLSVLRSAKSLEFLSKERYYYSNIKNILNYNNLSQEEKKNIDNTIIPPFVEDIIENESDNDYWMRTLETVLKSDGTPAGVSKIPGATYVAYRWANIVNSAYLAFWDAEEKNDEFVITDIGMTSENEIGWDGMLIHNHKKLNNIQDILSMLCSDYVPEKIKQTIISIFYPVFRGTAMFHENFMMFPISSRRMIVLICPYFRMRHEYKDKFSFLSLTEITCLNDEQLFAPNEVKYVKEQNGEIHDFHDKDKYIYHIKKLSSNETRYCNSLFLDRIHKYLGFSSLEKIRGSIIEYYKLTRHFKYARVDYSKLYEIIKDYQLGKRTM